MTSTQLPPRLDDTPGPPDGPARHRRRRRRPWWPVLVPLLVVAIGISLLVPGGRHQWDETLFRQASPYSTLAFDQPTALPIVVSAGQDTSFAFSVGNNEGHDVTYRYLVVADPTTASFAFAGGSVEVADGQTVSVPVKADPHCSGSPCRITVSLVGYADSVDFNVVVAGLPAGQGGTG